MLGNKVEVMKAICLMAGALELLENRCRLVHNWKKLISYVIRIHGLVNVLFQNINLYNSTAV